MKASAAISLFAVAAVAVPTTVQPIDTHSFVAEKFPGIHLCSNFLTCVESLAPTIETCAKALLSEGMNIIADVECLSDAVDTVFGNATKKACKGCLDIF